MSCLNCGKKSNVTCSGCKKAKYCSNVCQKNHKLICKQREYTEEIELQEGIELSKAGRPYDKFVDDEWFDDKAFIKKMTDSLLCK